MWTGSIHFKKVRSYATNWVLRVQRAPVTVDHPDLLPSTSTVGVYGRCLKCHPVKIGQITGWPCAPVSLMWLGMLTHKCMSKSKHKNAQSYQTCERHHQLNTNSTCMIRNQYTYLVKTGKRRRFKTKKIRQYWILKIHFPISCSVLKGSRKCVFTFEKLAADFVFYKHTSETTRIYFLSVMGHPAPFTSVAEFNELSGSLLLNSLLTRFRFPFYTGTLPLTKFPDMNLTTHSLSLTFSQHQQKPLFQEKN